jgi:redox-sensitive bicupin YhaK (pirin superfamily)
MCAGRGIIHSEMPEQRAGLLEGFQLWINLPANEKMQDPWYRDVQSSEIPLYISAEGIVVRVIAGQCYDIDGIIQRPVTQPYVLDIHFIEDNSFCCPLPIEHNAFIYVYKGNVAVSGQYVEQSNLAVLSTSAHEKSVVIQANQGSRVLLVAGAPLHEPIVQHGPFVMNTQEEVIRAIVDFKAGRF